MAALHNHAHSHCDIPISQYHHVHPSSSHHNPKISDPGKQLRRWAGLCDNPKWKFRQSIASAILTSISMDIAFGSNGNVEIHKVPKLHKYLLLSSHFCCF